MIKLSHIEYNNLTSEGKLIYHYKQSICNNIMIKGKIISTNKNPIYSLCIDAFEMNSGDVVIVLGLDENEKMYAFSNKGKIISSEDWTKEDCVALSDLSKKANYIQVKDAFGNPLSIGDNVVFIHSFSRFDKRLVKAKIDKITCGSSENSCRVFLSNFQENDDWVYNVIHFTSLGSTNLPIKYKLSSSLVKI